MKHAAFALLAVILSACVAPEHEFYDKVFVCDAKLGDAECGTDRAGRPMTCYPGHLLGGRDFCAETCDPALAPEDPRFACIDAIGSHYAGALIQRCQPSRGSASCPNGLACYRTDVLADEGLCVSTLVCSKDADCKAHGRTCGSEFAEAIAGSSLGLNADNLHCLQSACTISGSKCQPDEGCLFDFYASGNTLPNICVPKCDKGRCPPNFSCARKPHAPGSPDLCVPGVAGTTCRRSEDCLIGDCLDTGAGFHVCTLPMSCAADDYCGLLDQPVDKFICAEGVPGQAICVNTRPYGGGNCKNSSECPEDQQCQFYSALSPVPAHGDCRSKCGPDGRCDTRGGIPFVCVGAEREGGCHPTDFGLPCSSDADCFDDLNCVVAGTDLRSLHNYSPKICTTSCVTDADCDANRFTRKGGFCEADAGICRRRGHAGAPCDRDAQCYSSHCNAAAGCLE